MELEHINMFYTKKRWNSKVTVLSHFQGFDQTTQLL